MKKEIVLLADVGGTSVRFGIYESGALTAHFDQKYPVDKFKSFEEAAQYYLEKKGIAPTLCVVGAAGNIDEVNGEVLTTNTPWKVSIPKLKAKFPTVKHARLVNDFALQGWALAELKPDQYRSLFNQPQSTDLLDSKVIVIGLGTGCGTCFILKDGKKPQIIFTSESGHSTMPHVDFGNESENADRDRVLKVLKDHYITHNSDAEKAGFIVEHIISGTGVSNVYHALKDGFIPDKKPENEEDIPAHKKNYAWRLKSEQIEDLAKAEDPIALKTFNILFAYLGAHVGSMASATKAENVFFCGGLLASPWVIKKMETTRYFKNQLTLRAGMTQSMKQLRFSASLYRDMAELGAVVRAKDLIEFTKQEEQKRRINRRVLIGMAALQALIEENCPEAIGAMNQVVNAVNEFRATSQAEPNNYRVKHRSPQSSRKSIGHFRT